MPCRAAPPRAVWRSLLAPSCAPLYASLPPGVHCPLLAARRLTPDARRPTLVSYARAAIHFVRACAQAWAPCLDTSFAAATHTAFTAVTQTAFTTVTHTAFTAVTHTAFTAAPPTYSGRHPHRAHGCATDTGFTAVTHTAFTTAPPTPGSRPSLDTAFRTRLHHQHRVHGCLRHHVHGCSSRDILSYFHHAAH